MTMRNGLKKVKSKIKREYGRLMILRYGFWFIDVPRTSSSSISAELGKHFGRTYGKRNLLEGEHSIPQIFHDHIPAKEMRPILGNFLWNKIFTFAIVRNPWERTYSMYNYRKKVGNIPKEWNFREYVLELKDATVDTLFFEYHGFRYSSSDYLLGNDGKVIVNRIVKYEDRVKDLKEIGSRINLKNLGKLHLQRASPKHRHYSEFYDNQTKTIIEQLYLKDIELFDYTFDNK